MLSTWVYCVVKSLQHCISPRLSFTLISMLQLWVLGEWKKAEYYVINTCQYLFNACTMICRLQPWMYSIVKSLQHCISPRLSFTLISMLQLWVLDELKKAEYYVVKSHLFLLISMLQQWVLGEWKEAEYEVVKSYQYYISIKHAYSMHILYIISMLLTRCVRKYSHCSILSHQVFLFELISMLQPQIVGARKEVKDQLWVRLRVCFFAHSIKTKCPCTLMPITNLNKPCLNLILYTKLQRFIAYCILFFAAKRPSLLSERCVRLIAGSET